MNLGLRSPVALLLIGLALAGFGCKTPQTTVFKPGDQIPSWLQQNLTKPANGQAGANATTTADDTQPKVFPLIDESPDPRVLYLRQVLRNLQQADTFRASLNMPIENTAITADLDYVRVKGFHGTLNMPTYASTEIYVIGDNVYARAGTSTWLNLSNTEQGKDSKKVFNSVLQFKKDAKGYEFVSDRAKILNETTDSTGCKNYYFRQYNPYNGNKEMVNICVKNDLPTLVSLLSDDGLLEVHYRDFNQWIEMVPPM